MHTPFRTSIARTVLLAMLSVPATAAATELQVDVTELVLDNGMTFLLVPDPRSPVVTSFLYVDVGSVDEEPGITGTAHVLEHMMFKGTTRFGTTDMEAEQLILDEVDAVMAEFFLLRDRQLRGLEAVDEARLAALRAVADSLELAAREVTVQNDLDVVTRSRGFSGLNAFTSEDQTVYIETFPPNLLEVWALFESARIADPVLREFYSERDVVMEERRRSYDTSPDGRIFLGLIGAAYDAHPYQWGAIGWESDLQGLERAPVEAYFRENYAPNRLTVALVGGFDLDQVKELAERYFGPIPPSGPAQTVRTVEPAQQGEKRFTVRFEATPRLAVGFHTTAMTHPDRAVVEVLDVLLSGGRTSRLYQSLVLDQELAADVGTFIRGDKYPGLFIVSADPKEPDQLEALEAALLEELARMSREPVTEVELTKAKNRLEADLMRSLRDPTQLALNLATYHVITGSWTSLMEAHAAALDVTAEEIQRVAGELFARNNRTVGQLKPNPETGGDTP